MKLHSSNIKVQVLVLASFLLGCASSPTSTTRTVTTGYSARINQYNIKSIGDDANAASPVYGLNMKFDWPVDRAKFSRGFSVEGKRPHWGIDLSAPRGTPILAAAPGEVIYVGKGFRGYGRLVIVEHSPGWATFYSHLERFYVKEGDKVAKGDVLGGMGASGRATGVHLHFEVRRDRRPIDPEAVLPQVM